MANIRERRLRGLGVGVVLAVAAVLLSQSSAFAAPTFSVSISPDSRTVLQNDSAGYTVVVNGKSGFSGSVTLTLSVPDAVDLTTGFDPDPLSPSVTVTVPRNGSVSRSFTVRTSPTTPAQSRSIVVTGTSGALTKSDTAKVTVKVPTDFGIAVSPDALTIEAGSNGQSTVTVTGINGFAKDVKLSVSGLPTGVSAVFSPSTVRPGSAPATSTLTLTVKSWRSPKTATLTVQGKADGRTRTAVLALTVTKRGSTHKAFTLAGPIAQSRPLAPGVTIPLNLRITNPTGDMITLTTLVVTVTATSSESTCRGVDNYTVTRQFSGSYPSLVVPGRSNRLLSDLVPDPNAWPQLTMLNLPTNQDACKGVDVRLTFSGTARGDEEDDDRHGGNR